MILKCEYHLRFLPIHACTTFTPVTNGSFIFSTCNTASFDTRIAIMNTCAASGGVLTCNDDGADFAGFTSRTPSVTLLGGVKYYIAIGGYNNDVPVGSGTLTIEARYFTNTPTRAPSSVVITSSPTRLPTRQPTRLATSPTR